MTDGTVQAKRPNNPRILGLCKIILVLGWRGSHNQQEMGLSLHVVKGGHLLSYSR